MGGVKHGEILENDIMRLFVGILKDIVGRVGEPSG